ncbi:hypothetical protein DdX_18658 [Ditylenchus destructor]|uniref:F-box domain-containing protein n=1 Tax=Ditylenchus destructor TaxID=166010 RepID=A0AAD4MJT5_9BILA|nr:hypothetical protein DdX_18658 [Ditylenchus destructor]
MDNGTMVEAFKSLKYYQLAKTSLVSKRFRDLIRNNRHRLALLYVTDITMDTTLGSPLFIKIFNKKLSPEEYNQWVIRSQYSKQIPLENQMARMQSAEQEPKIYQFYAGAGCDDCNSGPFAFFVIAELKNENWPLFEHFIRLLTDPFVYLGHASFDWTAQKDVFNLLTGTINPDRIQCHLMKLSIADTDLDFPKLTTWAKGQLLCDKLEIELYSTYVSDDGLKHDEALLDFFMTGGHCASALVIYDYGLTKVLNGLAQKFMDFKNGDECHVVQSITGEIDSDDVEVFKRRLGEYIVGEKRDVDEIHGESKELVFEFVNKDIGQKCQFTATYF